MLFLDEPTAGVDPVSRREFWDLIVGLADEGTTVMVTTHYLDEAEHCNQLAFIYGGRIIARGSPEALKRAPDAGVTVEILSPENVALLDVLEDAALRAQRLALRFVAARHGRSARGARAAAARFSTSDGLRPAPDRRSRRRWKTSSPGWSSVGRAGSVA